MIMVNLAKSWLTMAPLSRSWLIMIHGTLAKIMARSWQDLGKATKKLAMVFTKADMSKIRITSFSVVDRVPTSWKAVFEGGNQE